jgi:hypothetical protein
MRIPLKTSLLGLALVLILAGPALSQGLQPEMWNGTHWKEFSKEVKVAYLKGVGNMADLEVAVSGKARGGCLSIGLVRDLKGRSIEDIVYDVDKYYKENPSMVSIPVVEVVVRQCTSLCKPAAPAAPPKK